MSDAPGLFVSTPPGTGGAGTPGNLPDLGGSAVALYRFKAKTTYLNDFSGNALTLTAGPSPTNMGGFSSGELSYNGGGNYLGQRNEPTLRLLGAMTCIAFVRWRVAAINVDLVCCGLNPPTPDPNNMLYTLSVDGSGRIQYFHVDAIGGAHVFVPANAAPLPVGDHVLGFTRSGTGVINMYMNGALLDTSAALGVPTGGGSSIFSIGAISDGSLAANWDFHEVGIYNVEATPAQMLAASQAVLGK